MFPVVFEFLVVISILRLSRVARGTPHAVTHNYARRVVRAHRGRFYERLYGIIINELKCEGTPGRTGGRARVPRNLLGGPLNDSRG